MARIPSPAVEAQPGALATPPRLLADLAPDYVTRVTVADEKDGHGHVRRLRPTAGTSYVRAAESYPFVTLTTEGTGRRPGGLLWTLTVDLDHGDSLMRICSADVPEPSWIIEKERNGHAQAGWIIEAVAVGPNARTAPQLFAEDVRAALTAEAGGDPKFTNRRQWNPLWPGWATEGRVIWGPTAPRSLGQLRAEMIARGTWPTAEARARRDKDTARALITDAEASMQVPEGERNMFVFDMARTRRHGTVAEAAAQANVRCSPPLPPAEVAGIVRSIERYEARTGRHSGTRSRGSTAWRAIQANRGRIGGTRGTQAQRIQRTNAAGRATAARSRQALLRAKEARRQARRGWTTARIAAHFQVTTRTVRRWLSARPSKADISGASGYPGAPHGHLTFPSTPDRTPTYETESQGTPPPRTPRSTTHVRWLTSSPPSPPRTRALRRGLPLGPGD